MGDEIINENVGISSLIERFFVALKLILKIPKFFIGAHWRLKYSRFSGHENSENRSRG